ncbi:MAG: C40 family peptidase [Burkholderiaceae bacterium]
MATSTSNRLQQYAAHALISYVSFYFCSVAAAVEVLPEETKVTTSNAEKLKSIENRASELAMQAMGMLGIHYKRGGNTPESGMDCSGLVDYVYKEAWGATLPRTSIELSKMGASIKTQDLQAGDLVFFNTLKRGFSHVGIYLGEHKFIHSPSSGGQVRIESMDVNYWKKRFNGARRISDPEKKYATAPITELSGPVPY